MQQTAPSQGFQGEDVKHSNVETYTKDWGSEYGPAASHNTHDNSGVVNNRRRHR